jgi:hypothetical protein
MNTITTYYAQRIDTAQFINADDAKALYNTVVEQMDDGNLDNVQCVVWFCSVDGFVATYNEQQATELEAQPSFLKKRVRIEVPHTQHLYDVEMIMPDGRRFHIDAEGNNRNQACKAAEVWVNNFISAKVASCNMIG